MYLLLPALLLGCVAWAGDLPLLAALAAASIGLCFGQTRRAAGVLLLASPCVAPRCIGVGAALSAWHSGDATRWERGRMLPFGHTGMDPAGRYYPVARGGCLTSLSELAQNEGYNAAYNATLGAWTRIAGPPNGAYTGELPSRAHALAALVVDGARVDGAEPESGVLSVGHVSLRFDGAALTRDLHPGPFALVVARPDWFAIGEATSGWPGLVVVARSTGFPVLYDSLEDEDARAIRARWRAAGS